MRKTALKGLISVLALLVLCFFFSGTIKTLTTAKALFISPQQGKLKEQISLTGYLVFSETESIRMREGPAGIPFRVEQICVTQGNQVKAGDILFAVDVSGLDAAIAEQEAIWQNAQVDLLALERQYAGLQITRADQNWLDAYDALLLAKAASNEAHLVLDVTAWQCGVELSDGVLPEGAAGEELLAAYAAAELADHAAEQAQTAMEKAARAGISDEAYQYAMQRRSLESAAAQAYDSLAALRLLRESGGRIAAGHAGYIVDILIEEGDIITGDDAAMTISAEAADCYLRACVPQNARSIAADTQVTVTGLDAAQVRTHVAAAGYDADGRPIIDVALNTGDIAVLGTAYGLLNNGIGMTISYVASSTSMLIPVSAVRGHGDERYVYSIRENRNSFGQTIYTIARTPVTVLDETGECVSVSGKDNIGRIAYMEDRSISEGSEVLPYE